MNNYRVHSYIKLLIKLNIIFIGTLKRDIFFTSVQLVTVWVAHELGLPVGCSSSSQEQDCEHPTGRQSSRILSSLAALNGDRGAGS